MVVNFAEAINTDTVTFDWYATNDELTFNYGGKYLVMYRVGSKLTAGSKKVIVRSWLEKYQGSWTEIPGTEGYHTCHGDSDIGEGTTTVHAILDIVVPTSKIRVMTQINQVEDGGSVTVKTLQNGSGLSVYDLTKALTGVTGGGGSSCEEQPAGGLTFRYRYNSGYANLTGWTHISGPTGQQNAQKLYLHQYDFLEPFCGDVYCTSGTDIGPFYTNTLNAFADNDLTTPYAMVKMFLPCEPEKFVILSVSGYVADNFPDSDGQYSFHVSETARSHTFVSGERVDVTWSFIPSCVCSGNAGCITGQCCWGDCGTCNVGVCEDACDKAGGAWSLVGTCAGDNPCNLPTGRCCHGDNDGCTSNIWECNCNTGDSGDWLEGASCTSDPCTPVTGKCCYVDTCGRPICASGLTELQCGFNAQMTWTEGVSCVNFDVCDDCPCSTIHCCNGVGGCEDINVKYGTECSDIRCKCLLGDIHAKCTDQNVACNVGGACNVTPEGACCCNGTCAAPMTLQECDDWCDETAMWFKGQNCMEVPRCCCCTNLMCPTECQLVNDRCQLCADGCGDGYDVVVAQEFVGSERLWSSLTTQSQPSASGGYDFNTQFSQDYAFQTRAATGKGAPNALVSGDAQDPGVDPATVWIYDKTCDWACSDCSGNTTGYDCTTGCTGFCSCEPCERWGHLWLGHLADVYFAGIPEDGAVLEFDTSKYSTGYAVNRKTHGSWVHTKDLHVTSVGIGATGNDPFTVSGNALITGGDLTIAGDVTVGNDLYVAGAFELNGQELTETFVTIANNLSDLANASTSRTNLGVAIGSNVQAHSSVLDATTASFLTADETKLDAIEALADVTDATNVATAGAAMISGVDFLDNEVSKPKLKDYAETVNVVGSVNSSTAFDFEDGNVQTVTVAGINIGSTITFSLANPPASGIAGTMTVIFTNGLAHGDVAFHSSIEWPGGVAPTLTASGVDIISFTTIDAGTTYYGFVGGINFS